MAPGGARGWRDLTSLWRFEFSWRAGRPAGSPPLYYSPAGPDSPFLDQFRMNSETLGTIGNIGVP